MAGANRNRAAKATASLIQAGCATIISFPSASGMIYAEKTFASMVPMGMEGKRIRVSSVKKANNKANTKMIVFTMLFFEK